MTLLKKIAVAGISAAVLAGSLMPAQAMPLPSAPAAGIETGANTDVALVQYRRHGGGWYGGHRGYRDYRPGYRRHNGYWFPLAAFGAGALIGGAIASQPRYAEPAPAYGGGDDINPRHYEWCADRYRSYDAYSNSFQPNYGRRQTCYSPYF
ncbi:BA14K family protein [Neorhizobium sp. T25_27]|uniref:BA14K family protein n=1 Tax=Neorhizobium sp. T25_27 TaxID=2093831 RepID=UPI000CF93179|nr:BA14K family protein [Neorhizobium sp. T25_27]